MSLIQQLPQQPHPVQIPFDVSLDGSSSNGSFLSCSFFDDRWPTAADGHAHTATAAAGEADEDVGADDHPESQPVSVHLAIVRRPLVDDVNLIGHPEDPKVSWMVVRISWLLVVVSELFVVLYASVTEGRIGASEE